jgi:hypothetical protein
LSDGSKTAADNTNEVDDDDPTQHMTEEEKMMALMGFGGFDSTKVCFIILCSIVHKNENNIPSCLPPSLTNLN